MKLTKKYIGKIKERAAYTIMAAPFILGVGIPLSQAYTSDFIKNYNQAIVRNADTDGDGQISPSEELNFKQTLVSEIAELKQEGKDLEGIIDWLKTR